MAYLCVDEDGTELRFTKELPDGTIEKMIGRPLTWNDEPVKI